MKTIQTIFLIIVLTSIGKPTIAYDYNDYNQRIQMSDLKLKKRITNNRIAWGLATGIASFLLAPKPFNNKMLNGVIFFGIGFGGKALLDGYSDRRPTITEEFEEQRKRDLFNGH
ncbi:hypothetical protein [Halobacteriovorax sp. CON-3]|uniref:hypothetical protein n=1 Tax=Halobacteriovorax sp. CON-3 TaxID=3157710 RepID=UPI00371C9F3C